MQAEKLAAPREKKIDIGTKKAFFFLRRGERERGEDSSATRIKRGSHSAIKKKERRDSHQRDRFERLMTRWNPLANRKSPETSPSREKGTTGTREGGGKNWRGKGFKQPHSSFQKKKGKSPAATKARCSVTWKTL